MKRKNNAIILTLKEAEKNNESFIHFRSYEWCVR